jgi:hypothetical protein
MSSHTHTHRERERNIQHPPHSLNHSHIAWLYLCPRLAYFLLSVFHPSEAENDPNFYTDLRDELKEELQKLGPLEVVKVFEVLNLSSLSLSLNVFFSLSVRLCLCVSLM